MSMESMAHILSITWSAEGRGRCEQRPMATRSISSFNDVPLTIVNYCTVVFLNCRPSVVSRRQSHLSHLH